MYKSLRGVNASVFLLMCSWKANPSSVPLGKQLVNEAVDPAELRLRETENGDVDLVSRSHEGQTMCGLDTTKLRTEQCLLWVRFSLVSRQSAKRTS